MKVDFKLNSRNDHLRLVKDLVFHLSIPGFKHIYLIKGGKNMKNANDKV